MEARMLSAHRSKKSLILFTLVGILCNAECLLAQSGSRGGLGGAGGGAPGGGAPVEKKRYLPKQFAPTGQTVPVAEVRLRGNSSISESRLRSRLKTREGRTFDPAAVQADVRQLLSKCRCHDVRTYKEDSPNGVIVTFEMVEQPTVNYVKFTGIKLNSFQERSLLKKTEVEVGQPLSRFRTEEAQRKLLEHYKGRGNAYAKIEIQEGTQQGDQGMVFAISPGPRQRFRWTSFEGNTIVSDSRLRTQIDSKPGYLWILKGEVDRDVIQEDLDKLTSYYRSLGFFRAKVTHDIQFDNDQEWASLRFNIDEGPRYIIRNVSVEGNAVYGQNALIGTTELRQGDFFDLVKMRDDVRKLKDAYGATGYIRADVKASPQFFEEPGQLDLVYKIDEGKQYRVGDIKVLIDGEYPHTRQNVVLNRIDMREGDIIDIRKLRDSERRLISSQLFESGPLARPEIAVEPQSPGTRTVDRQNRRY